MYSEYDISPRYWARGVVNGFWRRGVGFSKDVGREGKEKGGEKDIAVKRIREPTVPQNLAVYQNAISVRY